MTSNYILKRDDLQDEKYGLRIDLCGTPWRRAQGVDSWSPITIDCFSWSPTLRLHWMVDCILEFVSNGLDLPDKEFVEIFNQYLQRCVGRMGWAARLKQFVYHLEKLVSSNLFETLVAFGICYLPYTYFFVNFQTSYSEQAHCSPFYALG